MRIRRYAARLLASSAPAYAAPSSAPPQPAAPWLHAAADDCAICQLTRDSDPQVAPDGIKHKGHIAGLDPDGELLKSGEVCVRLAQRPPVPEAQVCGLGHDHSASKGSVSPEGTEETSLASESVTEWAVTGGALVIDEAADEQDVGVATPLLSGSVTEPEITRGACLVSGSIAEPQVISGVSLADKAVAETEVSEGVSLVSEAATEAADVATASEVTTGSSLDDKGVAEPDIEMGLPSVDESASEAATEAAEVVTASGVTTGVPLDNKGVAELDTEMRAPHVGKSASEAAIEASDVATTSGVTTGAPLDNKGVAEPDTEMGAPPVDESASEAATMAAGVVTASGVTTGAPLDKQRVAEPGTEMGASPVSKSSAEAATEAADVVTVPRVRTVVSLYNQGIAEPGIKMGASHVDESAAQMDFVHLGSLFTEAATHPELPERVSLANETATEREVSEKVSLVSEPATEAADVITMLEVTTGAPLDNEGTTEPKIFGPSLANESTAEMDLVRLGSLVTEATTHLGLTGRVTGAVNLDTEVYVEPEDASRPSLIDESSERKIAGGVSIATEAASEPEVTAGASASSGDNDAALNGPEPLDCDLDCANMQIKNGGESVGSEVLPSGDDVAEAVGSLNATSTDLVREKSPIADEVTRHDDAPSVSCVSGIVARSVGKSGRDDIICYARRGGKRKLDMAETKTDQIELGDGDIYDQCEEKATFDKTVPCESAMSTAGSADIKLADIKRNLVDNSASSRGKKRKVQRFECDIDYCHMTFKKRAELSLHKKNMCTVKSCGRHFRSHKYLRRHQRIHSEETPYKCPWEDCSMAFKWTWALADHFQVHTGEKPYKCRTPGCSKIYKYVSDFTRHRMRCKPQRESLISCN